MLVKTTYFFISIFNSHIFFSYFN